MTKYEVYLSARLKLTVVELSHVSIAHKMSPSGGSRYQAAKSVGSGNPEYEFDQTVSGKTHDSACASDGAGVSRSQECHR